MGYAGIDHTRHGPDDVCRSAASPSLRRARHEWRVTTQIFLNYRRDDFKIPAKITYDELEKRFGAGSVFKDLARLNAGEDFEAAINRSLNAAKVILVLMGPTWLDGDGSIRRIEDPNDFVRAANPWGAHTRNDGRPGADRRHGNALGTGVA